MQVNLQNSNSNLIQSSQQPQTGSLRGRSISTQPSNRCMVKALFLALLFFSPGAAAQCSQLVANQPSGCTMIGIEPFGHAFKQTDICVSHRSEEARLTSQLVEPRRQRFTEQCHTLSSKPYKETPNPQPDQDMCEVETVCSKPDGTYNRTTSIKFAAKSQDINYKPLVMTFALMILGFAFLVKFRC